MQRTILGCILLFITYSCQFPDQESTTIFSGKRVLFLGNSITQNGTYVSIVEYFLRKNFPTEQFDIVSIGLSSETVSCLTEMDHPFPRPCLRERLDRALAMTKPELIVACYGMNDGIYHPLNQENFLAYQEGIHQLQESAAQLEIPLIIQTPPPFDTLPISDKIAPANALDYSYRSPYGQYDEVLRSYADWLKMHGKDFELVIDLHTEMNDYVSKKRQDTPQFSLTPDGIHPNETGHTLMAKIFLTAIGVEVGNDPEEIWAAINQDPLFRIINIKRRLISEAWLPHVGYIRGDTVKVDDLGDLQVERQALEQEINRLLK